MKGSLIIVGFFILGILAGNAGFVPQLVKDSNVSFMALCALLFCVGLGIGMNPNMKSDLRSINPRYALLPVVTVLGSWAGAAVVWLVVNRGFADCMASAAVLPITPCRASSLPNTVGQSLAR